jgi:hypothetical protein
VLPVSERPNEVASVQPTMIHAPERFADPYHEEVHVIVTS